MNSLGETVDHTVYELLRFAPQNANVIEGGKGKANSFQYQINVRNRTMMLFTCNSSGYVSVYLGNFVESITALSIVPGPLVSKLRVTLDHIPGFDHFSRYSHHPGFSILRTVVNPDVMGRFQRTILNFQYGSQA